MDRDRLVDAGVALVSRFGAKGLSLTSVARQAGVARATAYRMFGGRDALVAAIVAREIELLGAKLTEWDGDADEVGGRIRNRVVGVLQYLRDHEAVQYILRNEPEEVVRAIVSTADSDRPSFIELLVDRSMAGSDLGGAAELYPSPAAAAEFMTRVVYSYLLVPESRLTDDDVADLVVRAIVR